MFTGVLVHGRLIVLQVDVSESGCKACEVFNLIKMERALPFTDMYNSIIIIEL